MPLNRYISPGKQFLAEVLLFVVPTAVAFFLSDLSFTSKIAWFSVATVCAAGGKYVFIYRNSVALRGKERTNFLDHHLELVVNDYAERYDTDYDVRANIMIPQVERSFSWQTQDEDRIVSDYL